MKPLSIVFMGTPDFAVAILAHLLDNGVDVKAVVTAPDRPAGRGKKIRQSDVKQFSVKRGLPVLQPANLKDPAFVEELQSISADLFVVVAFRMLPEVVWAMPPKGTINLHASLLPNYRGAAPIHRAVMNGETVTGVTTFFIEKQIDTGAVIEQREADIGENETVGELYTRLMKLGAECTLSTVRLIAAGNAVSIEQKAMNASELKEAPKLFKEDGKISFDRSVLEVHNHCRGLDPYPAAWCTLFDTSSHQSKNFKLFGSRRTDIPTNGSKEIKHDPESILFPCEDFYLRILEIQPEGKRRMLSKDFLAGNDISTLQIG